MPKIQLHRVAPLLGVALFIVALWTLHHALTAYTYGDIEKSVRGLASARIVAAIALTTLSYLVLTGYELIGLRYAGETVSYPRTALAAFVGYAFSNTVGYSFLSGGSVRLRLYSGWGLSASAITRVIVFGTLTFWVGYLTVSGVVFLASPIAIPATLHLPFGSLKPLGGLFLALVTAYGVLSLTRTRAFVVRGLEFPVPPPILVVAQILVAALDWGCASGTLFVLLPNDSGISYPSLLVVYLLAHLVGSASQVPGGVGVFETIMVILLARWMPASVAIGTLIAFRAIYYFLPLAASAVVITGHELAARREGFDRAARAFGSFAPTFVPTVFATITFVGGAILLVSGATPTVHWRLGWLRNVVPLPVVELSHFVGSVVGTALLILGWGLRRRLNSAYVVTMALLAVGVAVSILKGLDYEEAAILTVTLVVFAPASRYFYRKTSLTTERVSASWIAAIVVALSTSAWIGIFSYKHVSYSEKLWWSFAFSHDAPRFLRATAGSLVLLLLFAVARLLRTTSPRALAETAVDAALVEKLVASSKDTYVNLALLGDKSYLFSKSRKTFVMYAVQGRSWVVLGDPIGSTEERSELLWDFLELVDKHDGWPVFYEVGATNLPLYLDLGLGLFKIGEEARIPLADFALEGGRHKSLRQTKNRLEAAGCRFEIVPRETVSTLLDELAIVSDAWLSAKNTKEKGFSLGFFDASYLLHFPVALVRHQGQIVAFANVWHGADFEELSVDLMRFTPEAPAGLMDYLFVELLLYARAEGYRWFNLGMAPLSGLSDRALAPLWTKLGAFVFRHGDQFYHFKGLRDYKEKFDPVWEPKYVASPGGLALPRILSNVATLVSKGKKGIGSE